MKKFFAFALTAIALLAVSCEKKAVEAIDSPATATIEKTFTVLAPASDTKTALNGPDKVVWSEGDQITVVAKTTGNLATFTLSEGAGTSSAKFSGSIDEADAAETTFYAVYPASATLNLADSNYPFSSGYLTVKSALPQSIDAVENGFSSTHAVMTAKLDSDGKFIFRHGAAYFKLTISIDGVESVKFNAPGKLIGRPSYEAETGTFVQLQGTKEDITLNGPLTKGSTYYVPVMPHHKNKVGTLTLTFTDTEGHVAEISTSSLSGTVLETGKIYDLKSPAVSFEPIIVADDITINADATSGSIAYEITNAVSGGVLTAEVESGATWLSVGSISDDAVNLVAEANTGSRRSAAVTLTYTYGSKSLTKEVTVAQTGSASASEDYVWDFSSTEWQAELAKYGDANKDITNWNMTLDGLTFNSVSKSKWNTSSIGEVTYHYIQFGGKSAVSSNDRVFSFTTVKAGTVSVMVSNTGNSEATDRKVVVKDSEGNSQEEVGGVPSLSPTVLTFKNVAAGTTQIYVTGNALRFYKIEFHSN